MKPKTQAPEIAHALIRMNDEMQARLKDFLLRADVTETVAKTRAAASEDTGTFDIIITTEARDRQGDIVRADGWDFAPYQQNPVVLLFHNYASLPVGTTDELYKVPKGWAARGRFAPTEEGQTVRKLYEAGFINACSVGFIPTKINAKDDHDIIGQTLLEWSFVPVPANPEALSVMRSLNLDVESMRTKGLISPVEKGAVAEILTEEDKRRAKWEKMASVEKITSALYRAYFAEGVEVDAFPSLLAEAVSLLSKGLPDGTKATEGTVSSAVGEEAAKAYAAARAKAGGDGGLSTDNDDNGATSNDRPLVAADAEAEAQEKADVMAALQALDEAVMEVVDMEGVDDRRAGARAALDSCKEAVGEILDTEAESEEDKDDISAEDEELEEVEAGAKSKQADVAELDARDILEEAINLATSQAEGHGRVIDALTRLKNCMPKSEDSGDVQLDGEDQDAGDQKSFDGDGQIQKKPGHILVPYQKWKQNQEATRVIARAAQEVLTDIFGKGRRG